MCRLLILGLILILSTSALTGCDADWEISIGASDGDAGEVVRGSGTLLIEERAVSEFTRVVLTGAGHVTLTQGDVVKLTVETDDNLMGYIKTEVKNGTLYLGYTSEARGKNIRPSEANRFYLSIKDLTALNLSGAGQLYAASLTADHLQIHLSGAGDINVDDLTAVTADVRVSGAGDIALAGRVTEQQVTVSGAGEYRAGKLESKSADVDLSGAGNATVWATDVLDVRISGVGNIEYYGAPHIFKSSSDEGRIVRLGKP
jgi:hypothetical protein